MVLFWCEILSKTPKGVGAGFPHVWMKGGEGGCEKIKRGASFSHTSEELLVEQFLFICRFRQKYGLSSETCTPHPPTWFQVAYVNPHLACSVLGPFFSGFAAAPSWAVCPLSGAFAFLLISLFPIAGRAQYFLQPDFQRVRAGARDHPQSHHRHRPGTLLRQPQTACWSSVHRSAGPEQPRPQVRGHAL